MMEVHERLRQARIDAGYEKASDAARAFGWNYPTYSGHENGSRGVTTTAAQRYARALRVDVNWLLFGKAAPPAHPDPAPSTQANGFAESVTPFVARAAATKNIVSDFISKMFPDIQHHYVLELKRDFPDFNLSSGDLVIADPKAQPRDGQIVVANVVDPNDATAQMELMRSIQGVLVPSYMGLHPTRDGRETAVIATVIGSMRLPNLTGN